MILLFALISKEGPATQSVTHLPRPQASCSTAAAKGRARPLVKSLQGSSPVSLPAKPTLFALGSRHTHLPPPPCWRVCQPSPLAPPALPHTCSLSHALIANGPRTDKAAAHTLCITYLMLSLSPASSSSILIASRLLMSYHPVMTIPKLREMGLCMRACMHA